MSQESPKEGLTLRYAEDFQCAGADCPDDCCHGWQVIVDKKSYNSVKSHLPEEEVAKLFRPSEHQDRYDYTRIVMREDGRCPMLQDEGLCRLHSDFGEETLSITCRTYPRQIAVMGERTELGLMLSCPEAARKCLLDPKATELVKFDATDIVRRDFGVSHIQDADPGKPYLHYIDVVRDAVLNLLSVREFPFASRVFIAGFFLDQISSFIRRDADELQDDKLVSAFEMLSADGMMEGLYNEFDDIGESLEFAMSVIESMLLSSVSKSKVDARLVTNALACYGINATFIDGSLKLNVEQGTIKEAFASIAEQYRQRRDVLLEKYGEHINIYFENYCKNFWFRELFAKVPTPLAHMQVMVLRLAVLKFNFFSHQGLNELLERDVANDQAKKILDDVVVDSVYSFSRAIEHDEKFLSGIQDQLAEQGMDSFAHTVLLMKF